MAATVVTWNPVVIAMVCQGRMVHFMGSKMLNYWWMNGGEFVVLAIFRCDSNR